MTHLPLLCRFSEFFGGTGTIVGEVAIFDLWVVLRISVIAPQTEADDSVFSFCASALATGSLLPPLDERRVRLGRHSLRNASLLLGCVLGTGAKLYGAFAVSVPLHGKTANALAVFGALPVVPIYFAKVPVHQK